MIGLERNQLFSAPHIILAPGIAIILTVLGLQPARRRAARRARSQAQPVTDTDTDPHDHRPCPTQPRAVARRDRRSRRSSRPRPAARSASAATGRCSRSSGLRTSFYTRDGVVRAVDGIDFHVDRGEIMGLVGESGCGKSVTSLSIMRLIAKPGRHRGRRGHLRRRRTCSSSRPTRCARSAATGSR